MTLTKQQVLMLLKVIEQCPFVIKDKTSFNGEPRVYRPHGERFLPTSQEIAACANILESALKET